MGNQGDHDRRRYGPDVTLDDPAYIDATARLFGKVSVLEGASLWPYAVIRAETHHVTVGRFSNVQDHAMLHVSAQGPTVIGEYCSIAHHVVLHSATIGDNTLVGINATLMDGVTVGANSIVAGGAFLTEGTVVPENSVVMGAPGKVVKSRNNFLATKRNALIYHRNAQAYSRGDHRAWSGPEFEAWNRAMMADLKTEYRQLYPQDAAE